MRNFPPFSKNEKAPTDTQNARLNYIPMEVSKISRYLPRHWKFLFVGVITRWDMKTFNMGNPAGQKRSLPEGRLLDFFQEAGLFSE